MKSSFSDDPNQTYRSPSVMPLSHSSSNTATMLLFFPITFLFTHYFSESLLQLQIPNILISSFLNSNELLFRGEKSPTTPPLGGGGLGRAQKPLSPKHHLFHNPHNTLNHQPRPKLHGRAPNTATAGHPQLLRLPPKTGWPFGQSRPLRQVESAAIEFEFHFTPRSIITGASLELHSITD